jgi:hypothetical protein
MQHSLARHELQRGCRRVRWLSERLPSIPALFELAIAVLQDWPKSVDFATSIKLLLDKDILAVRGNDVYVAYNHAQIVWCSFSHDGGKTGTWTSVKVNANAQVRASP